MTIYNLEKKRKIEDTEFQNPKAVSVFMIPA